MIPLLWVHYRFTGEREPVNWEVAFVRDSH